MNFTKHDLGRLDRGTRVAVTLKGNAANVRLMDSANLSKFTRGQKHRYYGGLVKKSPTVLTVPNSGHWYVTVDLFGLKGSTHSSVQILPSALPELKQKPLTEVPSLVRQVVDQDQSSEVFDVFISHASEDKEQVARPLADELRKKDLRVWFDEFELKMGDSLRRKIDSGLAKSRFGIVVISRNFINKGWTNYELDGIITRSVTGEQMLLPIWHDITKSEVVSYSPSLADKVARNTAVNTVEEIADEVAQLIREAQSGSEGVILP